MGTIQKRVFTTILLIVVLLLTAVSTTAQTDDPTTIPPPDSVTIAGTVQPEIGCPGEWAPECADSQLRYDADADLWIATFDLSAGSYEYKAALNGSWDDNYGLNAEYYGENIPLEVAEDGPVTFFYDHKTRWVGDTVNHIFANVPGSFQDEIGCSGDWQPDCLRTLLQDPNGDGVYTYITALIPAGEYEAKVAENLTWDVNYGQDGAQDGANIPFSVGEGQAVIFNFDPATGILTIETSDDIPDGLITDLDQVQSSGSSGSGGTLPPPVIPMPDLVVIPGTIQSVLGCPGDWQPDCENSALEFDENDQLWKGSFDLPAGEYEYKVAIGGSWDVNFGLNAQPGGPNIPLVVEEFGNVNFFFDHRTGWVTDNVNSTIYTIPGDFLTEIGCDDDWSASCMRSWLQDPDGDGVFVFQTVDIPAGEYGARVALHRTLEGSLGAGGVPDGPDIPFEVTEDGTLVTFLFDSRVGELTIATGSLAPQGNINEPTAHWVSEGLIAWDVAHEEGNQYFFHYDPAGGALSMGLDGMSGGEAVALTAVNTLPDDLANKFPHLANQTILAFPDDARLARVALKGQVAVTAQNSEGQTINAAGLQIPGVIDDLYPYDGPLGVTFDGDVPTIRLWAPTARQVRLRLYPNSETPDPEQVEVMQVNPREGTWTIEGTADWVNKYYLFEVDVYVPSEGGVVTNVVTDPYSISLSMNSGRSQIINFDSDDLTPEGWSSLEKPPLEAPEDIIVYELHVRDFSVNDQTVPEELRGTYKAFTVTESDGMQHLAALADAGVTHLHLLPTFDIATIDEDKSNWEGPTFEELATYGAADEGQQALINAVRDQDGFNWGYDPYHYNVPEGSYSTDPDGPTRVLEFREMVQSVNETGLRLVIDVVYNHTNASGQSDKSVLDKVVPGYYHRLDENGRVTRSTCCENTATEHDMMRKLMIDSVILWATEYKVDGFRFDLMGHHMKEDMLAVREALDGLTLEEDGVDGSKIYVYGEGWNFGEVADNARGVNATQMNMAGTGIGTFNDRLRDAARGGSPFGGQTEQGFINGLFTNPNSFDQGAEGAQFTRLLNFADLIRVGMAGNLANYAFIGAEGNEVTGADVSYNGSPAGYTADPQENVIYVSKHDNETLFDIIQYKAPADTSTADRARMQTLGNSIVMLSQGIPFFQAGDDLLRSKSLDRNSYNSGDWFNRLDFTYQSNNFGVGLPLAADNQGVWDIMTPILADDALVPTPDDIAYARDTFREFAQIRQSSPLFRLQTEADVQNRLTFHNIGPDQIPGLIVMSLSDLEGEDLDPEREMIVVLINATMEPQLFTAESLAGLPFDLHPVQANSVDPLLAEAGYDVDNGSFLVPRLTTAVFTLPQAAEEVIEEEAVAEEIEETVEEEAIEEEADSTEELEEVEEAVSAEEPVEEVDIDPNTGNNVGIWVALGALGLAGLGAYAYTRRRSE